MTSFNATIELDIAAHSITDEVAGQLIDRFIDWHPAIGVSVLGRAELILTLLADDWRQAASTVMALAAGLAVVGATVETTRDFDRRSMGYSCARGGMATAERFMSVGEVATRLGVTSATTSQAGLPEPDAWIGQTRGWRPETIEAWNPTRPGRGVGGGRPRKSHEDGR